MAIEVGSAYVTILPSARGFGRALNGAVGPQVADAGKTSGRRFGSLFSKAAVPGIGAIGAAVAGVGVGSFLKSAVTGASDLSETMTKVGVVFGKSTDEVVAFAENSADAFGQSRGQALEAAGVFGNLLTAVGLTDKQAATFSTSMVKLGSDLASFNNSSPEEALDALRAGLVGETEPLRRFGININDAALRQEALARGLKVTSGPLSSNVKAQAAYGLILKQSGKAQGDFARTARGLANQQRIAAAQAKDLRDKIGGLLLPAVNKVMIAINKGIPRISEFGRQFAERVRPALDGVSRFIRGTVLPALSDLAGTLKGYGQRITTALGGIDFSGFLTGFTTGGELSAASFVSGLQTKLAGIDWGQVGVTVGTGIADALNAAGSVAARLTTAFTGLLGKVNWGEVSYAVGRQGLTIALGLVTGLLTVDYKSLFGFVVDHWFEVLLGVLAIATGGVPIGAVLGRIPLAGPMLKALVLNLQKVFLSLGGYIGRFVGQVGAAFFRGFASMAPGVAGRLAKALALLPTRIGVAAIEAAEAVGRYITRMKAGFLAGAQGVGEAVGRVFFGILGAIARGSGRALLAAGRAARSVVTGMARALTGGVQRVIGATDRLTGGAASRLISGLGSAARSAATGAGTVVSRISGALTSGAGTILNAAKSLAESAANGFSGLSTRAFEMGMDLVRGFISGIGSMAGAAADAAKNMASGAVTAAKSLLHIASPSRVFQQIGNYVSEGFAIGISQSASAAVKAAAHLATLTRNAVDGRRGGITTAIASSNRSIARLADQRAGILKKLAAATKSYTAIEKAAATAGKELRTNILESANVTQAPTGGAEGIRAQLAGAVRAARAFDANLTRLRRRGLNKDALAQLVSAGVQQGSGAATALVNASKADFAAINKLQGQLASSAKSAGGAATDALYQSGVNAAKGLVRGLTSQKKAIEAQMLAIAKSMKATIKKALGIRSPSRVFQEFGAAIGDGFAIGIDGGRGRVDAATQRLAGAATLSSVPRYGAPPGMTGTGANTYIRVQIGERDLNDIVRIEQDRRDAVLADGLTYRAA